MDIVLFIALITGFACVALIAALLYRGRELSRYDAESHARAYQSGERYTGYAENGVDRVITWSKNIARFLWKTRAMPFARKVKSETMHIVQNFAPTAYIIRVYRAIRGLHTGHENEKGEQASPFLQEVHAHKNGHTRTHEEQGSEEHADESGKNAEEHDKK